MSLLTKHLFRTKDTLQHFRARAYARGWGGWGQPPLKNFITCAKEIYCFRILFAC